MKNIALIGFMGTGKSSVGKRLAKLLKKDFVDIDVAIEKKVGCTIAEIFKKNGERYFRKIESEKLESALALEDVVIATGGGVMLKPSNRLILKRNAVVICLQADTVEILKRVKSKSSQRPLLAKNPAGKIRELLKQRAQFYRRADFTVNTTLKTLDQVVKDIVDFLSKGGFKIKL